MTTIKNPLARASPLPSLKPTRVSTPNKSTFSNLQPILPDILSTTVLEKRREKKHVRFSLKLETIEENSSLPNYENSTTKSNKRIINPWREDGSLYGAYVEYLEKQDALTADIPEINRPSRPEPEPVLESPAYTHTFVIRSKSPELIIDSVTVSTPPTVHLPRIMSRPNTSKKNNNNNTKQTLSIIDSYLKQRYHTPTPPRHIQSRKISGSVSNKNHLTSVYPTIKRADVALPLIKDLYSNEKFIQIDNPLSTKEYYQSKKLTEIITNPLPGTNKQIGHLPESSSLPNLSKTSQIPYHNHINNEPYFFQNHNNDHLQPIIHSNR